MFTDLYLTTTDPNLPLSTLFETKVLAQIVFSSIFHTLVYTVFFNLASYIFFGKILSNMINTKLLVSLLVIMISGFFARFFHVKEIYKSYNYDLEKTRNHLDNLYIGWIFIS